jgi:hypothetical protein
MRTTSLGHLAGNARAAHLTRYLLIAKCAKKRTAFGKFFKYSLRHGLHAN